MEVLPPALWLSKGFLVGEPSDHATCTVTNQVRARYPALVQVNDKYYTCSRPMSVPEFKKLELTDVVQNIAA